MGTRSTRVDDVLLVASGEQAVTINFKKGVGEFFVLETNVPPTADDHGSFLGLNPESMALDADQHLFVVGSGLLVCIARNPAF
ncbi:MAG: hypothetical protein ABJL72_04275 [Roseobacter sp.]